MKLFRLVMFVVLSSMVSQTVFAQNKKFDKALKKVDSYYAEGNYLKAKAALEKTRKSIVAKMGQQNTYMPGMYIREATIDLESGTLDNFDKTLNNALTSSLATFSENSASYAGTMIDIASIYNKYGNYRLSREYLSQSQGPFDQNQSAERLCRRPNSINGGGSHDRPGILQ